MCILEREERHVSIRHEMRERNDRQVAHRGRLDLP